MDFAGIETVLLSGAVFVDDQLDGKALDATRQDLRHSLRLILHERA
jgi:hypothetical protein